MFSVWTQHLKDEKQQERFKNSVLGSKQVLDRAVEILADEESKISKQELDLDSYVAGWDYRQAHMNGVRAGLRKAQGLLNLDTQNRN